MSSIHATDEAVNLSDDILFEPSEADLLWYRALCREREERLWELRVEQGPTFREKLEGWSRQYLGEDDPDAVGLGKEIARLADRARWLDADSWEVMDERFAAHLDSIVEDCKARAECR